MESKEPSAPPAYDIADSVLIKNVKPILSFNLIDLNIYMKEFEDLATYTAAFNKINDFILIINYLKQQKNIFTLSSGYYRLNTYLNEYNYEELLIFCAEISLYTDSELIIKKCIQLLGITKIIQLCCSVKSKKVKDYLEDYLKIKKFSSRLEQMNKILDECDSISDPVIIGLVIQNPKLTYSNFIKIENYHTFINQFKLDFRFTILNPFFQKNEINDDDFNYIMKYPEVEAKPHNKLLQNVFEYQKKLLEYIEDDHKIYEEYIQDLIDYSIECSGKYDWTIYNYLKKYNISFNKFKNINKMNWYNQVKKKSSDPKCLVM